MGLLRLPPQVKFVKSNKAAVVRLAVEKPICVELFSSVPQLVSLMHVACPCQQHNLCRSKPYTAVSISAVPSMLSCAMAMLCTSRDERPVVRMPCHDAHPTGPLHAAG